MLSSTPSYWRDRLKASGIHLSISLLIALLAALLVFVVWYPYPYREISGGRELFLLVVGVDVILGPLITLVVFNRSKPWSELRRDLAMIVLVQFAFLSYGLWTVSVARPVHLVFEIDRFRVVHAIDVSPELLNQTPPGVVALPLSGPTLLAVRPFKDSRESADATIAAVQGVPLSTRPDLWQPYAEAIPRVLRVARPVAGLKVRFPQRATEIDRILSAAGSSSDRVVYLPLVSRKEFWTVFLDSANAQVIATMPLDSF